MIYIVKVNIIDLDTGKIIQTRKIDISEREFAGWKVLNKLQFWALNNNKGVTIELDSVNKAT